MPVSVLLCEGIKSSLDKTVLREVLAGIPVEVKPDGGKYGMNQRIEIRREIQKSDEIYGIRDRDYDWHDEWSPGRKQPLKWRKGSGTLLGWIWSRTDIESYLTDPALVSALIPSFGHDRSYEEIYSKALIDLKPYSACRIALGRCRKGSRLPTQFGSETRQFSDHRFPDDVTEEALVQLARQLIEDHNVEGTVSLDEFDVFRRDAIAAIDGMELKDSAELVSGKDLVIQLSGWLQGMGYSSPRSFLKAVAKGIKNYQGEVWRIFPEWEELRSQVEGIN